MAALEDFIAQLVKDSIPPHEDVCSKVVECQHITSLSDFSVDGQVVSITFTGEDGVSYTRTFDLSLHLGDVFNDIAGDCVISGEEWVNMTITEKFQAIVDDVCACCEPTTTTTTSTSSSTTTTTTEATTTTTTTEASTTTTTTGLGTTTTTTSTTTTTTAAPTVIITSTLPLTSVTQVNNISGFTLPESVEPGETITGYHNTFTAGIQVVIQGPPLFTGNISLVVNSVLITCINLSTGGFYPVTINFGTQTYFSTDVIDIQINIGACPP